MSKIIVDEDKIKEMFSKIETEMISPEEYVENEYKSDIQNGIDSEIVRLMDENDEDSKKVAEILEQEYNKALEDIQ